MEDSHHSHAFELGIFMIPRMHLRSMIVIEVDYWNELPSVWALSTIINVNKIIVSTMIIYLLDIEIILVLNYLKV
jgi:hypothetical protein